MAMKGHVPGGGIASNKITERPIRTGTGSHSTRPGYVSQLGNKVGNHITDDKNTGYTGERMHDGRDFHPVMLGNQKALDVKGGGPGRGRDPAMRSGSQGTHGPTNPGMPGLPSTKGQWPD
jgi:hypothetical protein